METLNTYQVVVKTGRGKRIVWTRYARTLDEARASAEKAATETYYGSAKVLSVEEVRQGHREN